MHSDKSPLWSACGRPFVVRALARCGPVARERGGDGLKPALQTGLKPALQTAVCLLLTALAASKLRAGEAPPIADVGLGPVESRGVEGDPSRRGQVYRSQLATFTQDALHYGIRYNVCVDTTQGDRLLPSEGYLGMPLPSSSNWYHSGFLFLVLNGQDIGSRTPLASMRVTERGSRAIVDLVWHDPAAEVRARFLALPRRDWLACEIAIEPNEPLDSIVLRLTCFPSYFTAWNKRDGARRIRTPGPLIEQGKPATLPAKDAWWAVYYDEIFDVAKGEGEGPCAMLLLPDEAAEVSFEPGSYAVGTRIRHPASARRLRLAFWDFHGTTNAEALARLEHGAEDVRRELAALDFTPAAIQGVDLAKLRAEVEKAIESESIRAALGGRLAAIHSWLDRYDPAKEPATPASAIRSEERLLEAVGEYQDFVWEVKLAELLSTF